jgi:hypothetical protein
MMQVQCLKIPIVDGTADRLRTWIVSLAHRGDEVRAALAVEGILDEAVFYASEADGQYLYLYSRAADLARSAAAFERSQLPVDREFKQLIAECLDMGRATSLELVFAADSSGAGS